MVNEVQGASGRPKNNDIEGSRWKSSEISLLIYCSYQKNRGSKWNFQKIWVAKYEEYINQHPCFFFAWKMIKKLCFLLVFSLVTCFYLYIFFLFSLSRDYKNYLWLEKLFSDLGANLKRADRLSQNIWDMPLLNSK